ncbi:hypothetical protein K493DRAFT_318095 [Basidiobolus meristosporus CBS 931.73]|uniref:Uncharacterized protein n=1 Tax=Basidiobolus meristosporus CBS 931.73 TaxID=1314790 RepID=A0A1Y1XX28_9FUNG|nr:hypothetical protein K493DRAFT_318095 [Basidiobolus meristosporus CBS 931.73]|eukprot:ORX90300.1 hypothetical protein K493DRAFT_318095 [Basidiobolus meristosporus CBS 931.73]
MIALPAKHYTGSSQCSDKGPSVKSFFGNAPFYQQELPVDLLRCPKLSQFKKQSPPTKVEFSKLNQDEAIDVLYDLLSDTFDKLVELAHS